MLVLIIFAFISGFITIFAPCIWPILPIVLSSSLKGGRKKSLGTALGISLSFSVLTLTLSYIVKIIPFDPNVLRLFAVVIIFLSGLIFVIPKLSEIFQSFVSRFVGRLGNLNSNKNQSDSFWSGFSIGFILGVVWSPCAGPILATIASLSATRAVNLGVVIVTLFYSVGVAIPLFIFSILSNRLFNKTRFISKYLGTIEQVFGVIMMLFAVAIYTNYDKVIEARLLTAFPSYQNFLNSFESNPSVTNQLLNLKGQKNLPVSPSYPIANIVNSNLPVLGKAPEFTNIVNWINSPALTMNGLRGKVVLVDFWTYTCINCIRTLPFVTGWYEKYKDQGFVVVGVHTPEFEFEKSTANVELAIKQYGIHYPVAQDNNYGTWNAFSNLYWPADYLIDAQGNIRDAHFGEGDYQQTESYIQKLLTENGVKVTGQTLNMPDQTPTGNLTPESYLGSNRMDRFASPETVIAGYRSYTTPASLSINNLAYAGQWDVEPEYAAGKTGSAINLRFIANKVFLVLHPVGKQDSIKVFLDGKPVDVTNQGSDVVNGVVRISEPRLYELVNLKNAGEHLLKLEWQSDGIQAYAFTFG